MLEEWGKEISKVKKRERALAFSRSIIAPVPIYIPSSLIAHRNYMPGFGFFHLYDRPRGKVHFMVILRTKRRRVSRKRKVQLTLKKREGCG